MALGWSVHLILGGKLINIGHVLSLSDHVFVLDIKHHT